jgi:hypothetical protein
MFLEGYVTQSQIYRTLKWGIIFSVLWLGGLGSLLAVIFGFKANKAINASSGTLVGKGRAWWCIVVGGIGVALWFPVLIIGIINQF